MTFPGQHGHAEWAAQQNRLTRSSDAHRSSMEGQRWATGSSYADAPSERTPDADDVFDSLQLHADIVENTHPRTARLLRKVFDILLELKHAGYPRTDSPRLEAQKDGTHDGSGDRGQAREASGGVPRGRCADGGAGCTGACGGEPRSTEDDDHGDAG